MEAYTISERNSVCKVAEIRAHFFFFFKDYFENWLKTNLDFITYLTILSVKGK